MVAWWRDPRERLGAHDRTTTSVAGLRGDVALDLAALSSQALAAAVARRALRIPVGTRRFSVAARDR
jgi:hypothetical protein